MRKTNQLIDYMPKKKLDWIEQIWRDPRTSEVCINLAPGYICETTGERTIVAHDINAMIEIFRRHVHPVTTPIEPPKLKLVRVINPRHANNRESKIHLNGNDGFAYCNSKLSDGVQQFEGEWDMVTCLLCKAKHQREVEKKVKS